MEDRELSHVSTKEHESKSAEEKVQGDANDMFESVSLKESELDMHFP